MRRDDRPYDESEGHEEIAAIEAQWTRYWEAQGGPQGRADRIPSKAEFKIMWPYLRQLPKGSRVLDGGCGLGDWVVWLTRAGYPTVGLDVSRLTIGKLKEMFPGMSSRSATSARPVFPTRHSTPTSPGARSSISRKVSIA